MTISFLACMGGNVTACARAYGRVPDARPECSPIVNLGECVARDLGRGFDQGACAIPCTRAPLTHARLDRPYGGVRVDVPAVYCWPPSQQQVAEALQATWRDWVGSVHDWSRLMMRKLGTAVGTLALGILFALGTS